MKRILSAFLSFALCLTLLPATLPANAATEGVLSYSVYNGQVRITGCSTAASGDLTIPNTIAGYPVTCIGGAAFRDCKDLTGVTIPDSVTTIGAYAFAYCYSLTGVDIPEGVTSIGDYAFFFCHSLTSVSISESVTSIGHRAFSGRTSLTGIWVAENNPAYSSDSAGALLDKSGTTLIQVPGGFSGDYFVAEGVTHIGDFAFYYCTSLTNVTIPDSVTDIRDYAFYYCPQLTKVIIPAGVTSLGRYVFDSCSGLDNVYFAGDAPTFAEYTFYGVRTTVWYHSNTAGWDKVNLSTLREAAHIYPEYTYDNNHTCTTDGTERAVCLTCGEMDVRKAEGSAAHRIAFTSNNDATCTMDGTKTGTCKLCGVRETVTDEGSAFGHAYFDYSSNNDATCTTDGTKIVVCAGCGDVKTVTDKGSALGHAYSEYASNNDATCTTDGTKSAVCANCGDVKTVPDNATALGHSFTNYIFDDNYTCTVDGTETAQCDRCDATDWRVAVGSAAHRYIHGFCLYCEQPDPNPNRAILTGNLTTFGEGSAILNLAPIEGTDPAVTLTTEDGSYSLAVAPGKYILMVSKAGSVTRAYTVALIEGETLLDVMLQLPGDITGDGKITVADVSKAYAHTKKTAALQGYSFFVCDVNNDGKVTVADVSKLYAHTKKTASLW